MTNVINTLAIYIFSPRAGGDARRRCVITRQLVCGRWRGVAAALALRDAMRRRLRRLRRGAARHVGGSGGLMAAPAGRWLCASVSSRVGGGAACPRLWSPTDVRRPGHPRPTVVVSALQENLPWLEPMVKTMPDLVRHDDGVALGRCSLHGGVVMFVAFALSLQGENLVLWTDGNGVQHRTLREGAVVDDFYDSRSTLLRYRSVLDSSPVLYSQHISNLRWRRILICFNGHVRSIMVVWFWLSERI